MLKIYGQARSRTFRVLWFCKESNIAYEHIPVTIGVENAQCKEDWYLKLNPNARVPTIEDDGFVMWESSAINLYLAKKYNSPLYPRDIKGEGRVLQWAFFVANDIEPPMITMYQNRVVFPPEKRNAALADDAEKKLLPKLKLLDDQLAKTPNLGGGQWDMADFIAASVLFTLQVMKFDLSKFPKLDAWLRASLGRPAAKEAIKLRG
ncbi:MAG: glutathione S-transferase family protein [Burkholderiales bacterium]